MHTDKAKAISGHCPIRGILLRKWKTKNLSRPRSPDFSPPAFILCCYLKDRMFVIKPKNISEVKVSISEEIRASPRSICKSVIVELRYALEKMYGFKWWSFGASPINPNNIIERF